MVNACAAPSVKLVPPKIFRKVIGAERKSKGFVSLENVRSRPVFECLVPLHAAYVQRLRKGGCIRGALGTEEEEAAMKRHDELEVRREQKGRRENERQDTKWENHEAKRKQQLTVFLALICMKCCIWPK